MPEHKDRYDTTITKFSPDGRIKQVEYAREAVKRGALSAAIKYDKGILIIADRQYFSPLVEKASKEKITKVTDNCCCVSSGLVADTRVLIDYARRISARNRIRYSEPIDIRTLVTRICNIKRSMTQYGGTRPFGVSLLFCGEQNGHSFIFETDPSGAFKEYNLTAIGSSSPEVKARLFEIEESFSGKRTLKDSFDLLLDIMTDVNEKLVLDDLEICVLERDHTGKFDYREFDDYLEKYE